MRLRELGAKSQRLGILNYWRKSKKRFKANVARDPCGEFVADRLCLRCSTKKAAGGVLTAKQAPHRPGTAPALGLRSGNDVRPFYLQTNLEWENVPCHSRVGCAPFDPLWLLSPP